jgi:hypothetical protein
MNAPTDPTMSQHGLVLYKACMDNLDYFKRQQWTVTNYLALIYAAIVWVDHNIHQTRLLTWILSGFAVVAAAVNIGLLLWFQRDTARLRRRLASISNFAFQGEERTAFQIEDDPNPFARGWQVLIALIGVSVIGALVVIIALFRGPIAS